MGGTVNLATPFALELFLGKAVDVFGRKSADLRPSDIHASNGHLRPFKKFCDFCFGLRALRR
jgi:hypothetical protein